MASAAAAHYLLPEWDGRGIASPRYGSVAIGTLLQMLAAAGAYREHLRAKVFGGAHLFKGTPTDGAGIDHLGSRNVETALEILAKERIPIACVEAMGSCEQRVVFQTDSGESLVTCL
jgi:chemotaxis protein CheD